AGGRGPGTVPGKRHHHPAEGVYQRKIQSGRGDDLLSLFIELRSREMDEKILFWFSGLEKSIETMDPQQRETFFCECGKNCVQQGTLDFYRQLYDSAAGDLDAFFQKVNEVPGLRAEILAPGGQYAFCFAECTCML